MRNPAKAVALAASVFIVCCWPISAASTQNESESPRLVLVISIDQMRADYLDRFDGLFTGGLRRLVDEGAVFTNAMYRHSATETGPGHAVILSGRHPSSSGIIGNAWFDPLLGRTVNVIGDPSVRAVGGQGAGASPHNFVGFTFGDTLKIASPESKVVGVSLKDRSAILLAGRSADAAFWYSTTEGIFITSSYYLDEVPAWLDAWNGKRVADSYAGQIWTRLLDDESIYLEYAGQDDIDGEWDRQDTVFPHRIRGNPPDRQFYGDLPRTPFVDRIIADVALEAMAAYELGGDTTPDIFAVGFSGGDYVGHTYGPDSQEVMDQILRLDRLLGEFFDEIDERVGLDRTLVVLTADHGVMPLVEVLQTRGTEARRVDPRTLREMAVAALGRVYDDPEPLIAEFGVDGVYLDRKTLRERAIPQTEVEAAMTAALLETGMVAAVYNREQLVGSTASEDPYLWLYRNSFFPSRSPDLAIRLNPYLYPSSEYAGGTGHGSAYEYDRRVPIIFMGDGIRAGRFSSESGPEDIAPTLATLLGLEYPIEPDARILREILP